ncbi:MAG TPA: tRNA (adenosine(37)-N6)-dimethylallyltransferase MiaA [Candidatus Caccovivens faecavium]|nr:tRNA (adenosine(37)-N6)-dimethylallyltransferase MiaA [Candidatus Caccovivens faecavium]
MDKVLFILGPTAVGKTEISIKLAKEFNGEIISSDSVQIYRGLDIGSAKVKKEEMKGVPHHLIDIVSPNESFTAFDMTEAIKEKIKEITSRGHLPIVVGGTSLYVKSLILGYNYGGVGIDAEYRNELNRILEKDGLEKLCEMLKNEDESAFDKIDKHNPLRVIRALEIAHLKGEKKTAKKTLNPLTFALILDRQKLYDRINKRVDIMLKDGLVEEVKTLLEAGVKEDSQSMHAIGYKEVISFLKGEISYEKMVDLIKQHSRNYAKRQLTFLRGMEEVNYVDVEDKDNVDSMLEKVKRWLYG